MLVVKTQYVIRAIRLGVYCGIGLQAIARFTINSSAVMILMATVKMHRFIFGLIDWNIMRTVVYSCYFMFVRVCRIGYSYYLVSTKGFMTLKISLLNCKDRKRSEENIVIHPFSIAYNKEFCRNAYASCCMYNTWYCRSGRYIMWIVLRQNCMVYSRSV